MVDSWDELKEESSNELLRFLREGHEDSAALARARVAQSILSAGTRLEATESAREQTRVVIARGVSRDHEDFAEYVRISLPNLPSLPPREPLQAPEPI